MKHLPKGCKLFYIVPLLLSACNNDGPISSSSLLSSSEESTSSSSSQYSSSSSQYSSSSSQYSSSSSEYSSNDSTSSVSSYSNPIPEEEIVPFSSLTTTKNKMTISDYRKPCVKAGDTIPVFVTYISFIDGYKVDKEYFEDVFNGVYDLDNCIRSVSSYFKYNSYGKVNFEFYFYYYDSNLTCSEAWHLVNDEDEDENFYGNRYLSDIFKEIKDDIANKEYFQKLDANKDGYIDFPIFVLGENSALTNPEEGLFNIYGSAVGYVNKQEDPNVDDPVLYNFIKTDYERMLTPVDDPHYNAGGDKTLIHECSHMFGLLDYYDFHDYKGTIIDTLGTYAMMSHDVADWDPFSKFYCGFLEPYVVEEDVEKLTIRLRNSSEYNEAILVPLFKGWNETCFDEYLLVDVMAPVGANGFDWDKLAVWPEIGNNNLDGGVRILHVDNRLGRSYYDPDTNTFKSYFIDPFEAIDNSINVFNAFCNSNGVDPMIEGESRFYHLVDFVPSDLSSKYRINTTNKIFNFHWMFNTNDLFGPGDVFELRDSTNEAFVNAPFTNCNSIIPWSITVQEYDPIKHEAVITIQKIWYTKD